METESNFYTGLTQDISSGGLFIATHQLRSVGEVFMLKFSLPGHETPIEVECEVRWVRESTSLERADLGYGMGVNFRDLPPAAEAAIKAFIARRDSLFYDAD